MRLFIAGPNCSDQVKSALSGGARNILISYAYKQAAGIELISSPLLGLPADIVTQFLETGLPYTYETVQKWIKEKKDVTA